MAVPLWFCYLLHGLSVVLLPTHNSQHLENPSEVFRSLLAVSLHLEKLCHLPQRPSQGLLHSSVHGEVQNGTGVDRPLFVTKERITAPCRSIIFQPSGTIGQDKQWVIKIHPILKLNVTILYLKSDYIQTECHDSRFEIIVSSVDGLGMPYSTLCNEVYMRSLLLPVSDVTLRFKHLSVRDSPELLAFYQVFDPNTTQALRQDNTSVLDFVLLGLHNHGLYVWQMKKEVYHIYHFHTYIRQRVRATVRIWCVTSSRGRALPISVQIYDGPYTVIQPPNWGTDLRVPIIGHLVACGESSRSQDITEKIMETRSSIGDLTLVIMTLESQAKTVYGNATLTAELIPCPGVFCTFKNTILADPPDTHHDPALYQRVIIQELHSTRTVIHFISTFNAAKFGRLVFLSINISDDYISDCAVNSIILTAHQLLGVFCSRAMMSYLTSSIMQEEGIIFGEFCSIFFTGYRFGGKTSLTYSLSLSECSAIINLCENDLINPYGTDALGFFAMNSRLAQATNYDFILSRRPYHCVKLYGISSDSSVTIVQENKVCNVKIIRMDNTLFTQITVKVSDALLPIGSTHDKECSALVTVQKFIGPTGKMSEIEAIYPTLTKQFIAKDIFLWASRGCPWIGSFFSVTITNPEDSCLPLKDNASIVPILTVCGSVEIGSAGFDYQADRQWVFNLEVFTSHEDTMRTCCYMDFTVEFPSSRTGDLMQLSVEVVEFFKRNGSVGPHNMSVMRYQYYPTADFQFVVSFEFRMKNGHIVTHSRGLIDCEGQPCVGETSNVSYLNSNSIFNISYNRRYVDRLYSAIVIGPAFGLCSQSPIPYTWWHSCDVHCYRFYRPHSPLSWTEASQYCEERGGHLITPHTGAEWTRLFKWSITGTQNGFEIPGFEAYRAEIFNERLFFLGLRRNSPVSRWLSHTYFIFPC